MGLYRGRRSSKEILTGDALDFWRVVNVEEKKHLLLIAEMKLPGRATLEFNIVEDPKTPGTCTIHQNARFSPKGLLGILYWYSVLPFHGYIFKKMLRNIARVAEAKQERGNGVTPV